MMSMPPVYLLASSCICAQNTLQGFDLPSLIENDSNMLTQYPCDFKQYINPVQIRRMSRVLKMGFAAALHCLNQIPDLVPQAIAIGTGKGSLSDTELFLNDIRTYQETSLNSIPFIQSTYNQLSGMIALNKKIDSYNTTYVHRAFSLESAMLDMQMFLAESPNATALIGSYDEMTPEHFEIKKHWGYWKSEPISNLQLLNSNSLGTIAGEGAGFFLLGNTKPALPAVAVLGVQMLYKPSTESLPKLLDTFLNQHQLQRDDIHVFLSGWNGDSSIAEACELMESCLGSSDIGYYKHLCGEYDTAAHVAISLAQHILQIQQIPAYCMPKRQGHTPYRYALIYNNYFSANQSFWLLEWREN